MLERLPTFSKIIGSKVGSFTDFGGYLLCDNVHPRKLGDFSSMRSFSVSAFDRLRCHSDGLQDKLVDRDLRLSVLYLVREIALSHASGELVFGVAQTFHLRLIPFSQFPQFLLRWGDPKVVHLAHLLELLMSELHLLNQRNPICREMHIVAGWRRDCKGKEGCMPERTAGSECTLALQRGWNGCKVNISYHECKGNVAMCFLLEATCLKGKESDVVSLNWNRW